MVIGLRADTSFEFWLAAWEGWFDWDAGNTGKLAKHGLTTDDVEALFEGDVVYAGRIERPSEALWTESRFLVTARSAPHGRCYSLIVTTRQDTLHIISCRRSRPEEEKRHDQQHGS